MLYVTTCCVFLVGVRGADEEEEEEDPEAAPPLAPAASTAVDAEPPRSRSGSSESAVGARSAVLGVRASEISAGEFRKLDGRYASRDLAVVVVAAAVDVVELCVRLTPS